MTSPRFPFFYGWVVVGLSFLTLAVGGSANISFSLFYVALLKDFGWSRAEAALAFSISMLVFCGGGPVVGWMTDRLGPRRLMPAGVLLLSAGLLASSQISALWHLYLLYGVVISLGITSIGFVPTVIIVSRWFTRHRAMAVGIAQAGQGVGALLLLPLIQGVIGSVGWRGAYVFLSALVFLALLPPLWALQRGTPQDLGLRPLGEEEALERAKAPSTGRRPLPRGDLTLRDALLTYRFWTLSAVGFVSGLSFSAMMVHPVAHMADLGYPHLLAAAIFGLTLASRSGGGILGGLLSDRLGREQTYTAFACLSLLGVIFLLELRPSAPWMLYAFALSYGLGSGAAGTISSSLHADLFLGRNFGAIFGLTQVGAGLGAALGPWLAGLLYDRLGGYGPAFQAILLLIALSAAGIWMAAPRRTPLVPRTLP